MATARNAIVLEILSGMVLGTGAGRFVLNTLRIRENLGRDPVAERRLRNMVRHLSLGFTQPPAELPADIDRRLDLLGYGK